MKKTNAGIMRVLIGEESFEQYHRICIVTSVNLRKRWEKGGKGGERGKRGEKGRKEKKRGGGGEYFLNGRKTEKGERGEKVEGGKRGALSKFFKFYDISHFT